MEQKKDPFPRQVSVFPGRNVSEQESSKGRCAKGPSRHVHIWSQHSAHSWHGKEVLGRRHGLHAAMAAGSVNKSSLVSVAWLFAVSLCIRLPCVINAQMFFFFFLFPFL